MSKSRSITVVLIFLVALAPSLSYAVPPVGHDASQIRAGTFGSGNYVFPNQLNVTQQLYVDGSTFFVDSSNNQVGVGTLSPMTLFDVGGDITLSGGSRTIFFNGGNPRIVTYWDDITFESDIDNNGNGDLFSFKGNGIRLITVANSGNVGIGTQTPSQKLTVNGTIESISGGFKFPDGTTQATAAGTGNISGAGTANSLTKFISSGLIGDSAIYESDGFVGIGTTSPQKPIDIFSTSSSYGQLRINRNSGTAGEASIGFFETNTRDTNDAWVAGVGAWGNIGDFVIGNENNGAGGNARLVIEKDGDVGIGINSPGSKLHVDGAGEIATFGNSSFSDHYILIRDDIANGVMLGHKTSLNNGNGGVLLQGGTNKIIAFDTNNNGGFGAGIPDVVISAAGDVGIGTIAPQQKLEVNGSVLVRSPGTDAHLYFLRGDGKNASLQYDGGTQGFEFRTNGTSGSDTKVFISDSGNVGIGTTNPQYALSLQGTFQLGADQGVRQPLLYRDAATGGLNIDTSDSGDAPLIVRNGNVKLIRDGTGIIFADGTTQTTASLGNISGGGIANYLPVFNSNSTLSNSVIYQNGSNVGVGIINPSGVFHILTPNATPNIKLERTNFSTKYDIRVSNNGLHDVLTIENAVQNAQGIYLESTGNVGIGTTTPAERLHVKNGDLELSDDAGTYPAIRLKNLNAGGRNWTIQSQHPDGMFEIRDSTSSNNVFVIDDTGNIGIGTTSPSYRLHVNDTIAVGTSTGGLGGDDNLIRPGSSSAFLNLKGGQGRAKVTIGNDILRIISGSTNGEISFHTGATSSTNMGNQVMTLNGTNVGIGTTTPATKLHIVGGQINISEETSGVRPTIYFNAEGSSDDWHITADSRGLRFWDDTDNQERLMLHKNGAIGLGMNVTGSTSDITQADFVLKAGNAGIGTIAPEYPLDVYGTGQFGGAAAKIQIANDADSGIVNAITGGANLSLQTQSLDRVYVTSSGNVGIGTTNPIGKLHISDGNLTSPSLITSDYQILSAQASAPGYSIISAANSSGQRAVFKGVRARGSLEFPTTPSSGDSVLSFLGAIYDGSTTQGTALVDFIVDGDVSSGVAPQRISFVTSSTDASSRTERMTIKSNGNIGIGTTTPNATLDIFKPALQDQTVVRIISGGGSKDLSFVGNNGNEYARFSETGNTDPGKLELKDSGNTTIQLLANGNSYFNTAGNVGIGTSSPGQMLTVNGTIETLSGGIKFPDGTTQTTAGDGNVSGAGTANYLSKFTGVSNVGNSLLFENGTNIGLGTTAPNYKFEVENSGNSAGTEYLLGAFDHSASNAGVYVGYLGGSGIPQEGRVRSGGNVPLALGTTAYMQAVYILNSNGNVGIGTANPTDRLHVNGSIVTESWISGPTSTGRLSLYGDRLATQGLSILDTGNVGIGTIVPGLVGANRALTVSATATGQLAAIEIQGNQTSANNDFAEIDFYNGVNRNGAIVMQRNGADNSADMKFYTSNAGTFGQRMVIDSSGNVGIGTTNPTGRLHAVSADGVDNTDYSFRLENLDSHSSHGKGLLLKAGGNPGSGSTEVLQLQDAAGSNLFAVMGNGNVGIGTTNPATKLEIAQGAIRINASGSSNTAAMNLSWHAGVDRWSIGYNGSESNDPFFIASNNGRAITVLSTGNVGIGTSTPQEKLHINGGWLFLERSSGIVGIQMNNTLPGTPSTGRIYMGDAGANGYDNMVFSDENNVPRMVVNVSSGNVGIGTTSPTAQLHVKGDGRILLEDGSQWQLNTWGGGHFSIEELNPNVMAFFIENGTGNIGIGTTSPDQLLDVAGNLDVNNNIIYGAGDIRGVRYFIPATETNGYQFLNAAGGNTLLGFSENSFEVQTNSSAGSTTRFIITNGTTASVSFTNSNVGIGTTTPTAKLFVKHSDSGVTLPGNADQFVVETSGNTFIDEAAPSTGRAGVRFHVGADSRGSIIYHGQNDATYPDTMLFATAGVQNVVIKSGNVGIGTTNPGAKLDVTGKIKISDDTTTAAAGMLRYASNTFQGYNGTEWLVLAGAGGGSSNYWQANGAKVYYNDGNVGIGTNDPQQKLDVAGDFIINAVGGQSGWDLSTGNSGGQPTLSMSGGDLQLQSTTRDVVLIASDGSKMILKSGGNVGIGTTTPGRRLEVQDSTGSLRISNTVGNVMDLISGTGGASIVLNGSRTFNIATNSDMNINSPSNVRFTVDAVGNVGIGTISPSTRLEVTQSGDAATGIRINANSNPAYNMQLRFGTINSSFDSGSQGGLALDARNQGGSGAWGSGGGFIAMHVDSSEKMRVTKDGNVGIGTATFDSFTSGLQIKPSARSKYGVLVTDTDDSVAGALYVNGNGAGQLYVANGTGDTKILLVGDGNSYITSGNLGIGTTNPTYALETHGPDGEIVSLFGNDNLAANNGHNGGLGIMSNSNTGIATILSTGANSGIKFITNDGGTNYDRMIISSTGNVGIGTSSPSRPLHIEANNSIISRFVRPDGANTQIDVETGSGTSKKGVQLGVYDLGGDNFRGWTGTSTDHPFELRSNSTTRIYLGTNGNVGIGTTNPSAILHTNITNEANRPIFQNSGTNGVNNGGIVLKTTSTGYNNIDFVMNSAGTPVTHRIGLEGSEFRIQTASAAPIGFITNNAERMRITETGNIGIGTTNPTEAKLVVQNGSIYVNNDLASPNGRASIGLDGTPDGTANAEVLFRREGSEQLSIKVGHSKGVYFDQANWDQDYTFDTASHGDIVVFKADGNVGIGTISPIGKLNIESGDSGVASAATVADDLVIESTSATGISILGTNTSIGQIRFGDPQDNGAGTIGYNHSTNAMQFQVNGMNTPGIFIDSTNKVGIGTASPAMTFDVLNKTGIDSNGKIHFASTNGGLLNTGAHIEGVKTGAWGTRLDFYARDSAGSTTKNVMSISGEIGSVGIGTTTPTAAKLVVSDTTPADTSIFVAEGSGEDASFYTFALGASADRVGLTLGGDSQQNRLWFDDSEQLRFKTSVPSSDVDGTVIGTQSSSLDTKNLKAEFLDTKGALNTIVSSPVYTFTYKNGAYNNQEFVGIVTDYSPTFGMDKDATHPAGKSLNEITAIGYTFSAIKELNAQNVLLEKQNQVLEEKNKELEARIEALEKAILTK